MAKALLNKVGKVLVTRAVLDLYQGKFKHEEWNMDFENVFHCLSTKLL